MKDKKIKSENSELLKVKRDKLSEKFARIYSKYGTIVIFLIIFIIAASSSPIFLKTENLRNVLVQIAVFTLLAFGETFIIIMGHIDVSVGMSIALSGCVSAMVMSNTQSLTLAVLAGIGMGMLIGLINGFLITQFKIPAFIATLAMTTVARGAVLIITKGVPVTNLGNYTVFGQGSILGIPNPILILALFMIISWLLLHKMQFGRHLFAIGGNINAAYAAGVRVKKVVMKAFLYNGVLVGVAGIVFMSRINSGWPAAGLGYEFIAISAVVIGGTSLMGGRGAIVGTLLGSLIIGVITNILNLLNVNAYWQQVARGLIIAIAVILDVFTKEKIEK